MPRRAIGSGIGLQRRIGGPGLPTPGWIGLLLGLLVAGLQAAPVVTQVTPTFGAPGTLVTISGTDLNGVTAVLFSTAAASFSVAGTTRITAIVPTNGTIGPITVSTTAGTATSAQIFTVAPRLTGFTPALGAPGDTVVINGANFIPGGTTVRFDTLTASAEITAETQLQAQVPAGAKTGPISVSTFAGTGVSQNNFTVIGPGPVILGFSPADGLRGDTVVIQGLKFTGASVVKFNSVSADFSVTADTQILAVVPLQATTGPISVTTPAGTTFTDNHFVVRGLNPVITGFDPVSGPVGTLVTLSGRSFTGATAVRFGGADALFQVTADTQIQATVPTNATTGPIAVRIGATLAGASAQPFVVTVGPTLTDFTPDRGAVGTAVIITGTRFTGATGVKFGSIPSDFVVTADTQIHTTVPTGATNGLISVSSASGTALSAKPFIVLPPGPVITRFTPSFGAPGIAVTIEGAHFTGATAVMFGGADANYEVTADTQIHALVPLEAVTGPISVATPGGTNSSSGRFFLPPRIISFVPTNGPPGVTVTIQGANFDDATAVTFNGTNASVSLVTSNQITAVVPPAAATGPLTVTAPGGTAISTNYFGVPTTIASFTPAAGPPGTQVTVSGTSFNGASAVLFGGARATFTTGSPDRLVAAVPSSAATGPITVIAPQGTAVSTRNFTVSVSGDLEVNLTDLPGPAIVGDPIQYTLVISNQGPSDVTGVVLTNRLPAGLKFVSVKLSQGSGAETGGVVICQVGALAAGASAGCRLDLVAAAAGPVTNSVSVSAREFDPIGTNNIATLVTLVREPFNLNLVRNGDAESAPGAGLSAGLAPVPGWTTTNALAIAGYGTEGAFPTKTSPGPPERGEHLFWGGPTNAASGAFQTVAVAAGATAIDTGGVSYHLAGYLGGAVDQGDNASFQAKFLGQTSNVLGQAGIGPVTATDRTNTTGLLLRAVEGLLPAGTRRVEFRLQMNRVNGAVNEAYADNLSFILSTNEVPSLSITRAGGSVLLSWPISGAGLALESAGALPAASWNTVTNLRATLNDRLVVTNALSGRARFYRLRGP